MTSTSTPAAGHAAQSNYYRPSRTMRALRFGLTASQRLWPALGVRAAYRLFGTPLPPKWLYRGQGPGAEWRREGWAFEDASVGIYHLAEQDSGAESAPVVLLVHGYGCSRGVWWWWRRRLEAAGHVVATVSLNPPWADIDALSGVLAARIREVQAATGAQEMLLIGHSMGGLVSRAYLKDNPDARVPLLMTLATPHRGSALARLGIGRNARQMEPASPFLAALANGPLPPHAVSLRATHDDFVCPQDGQKLPGMQDVPLAGVGHLALLFSRRALAHACALLAAPQPPERNQRCPPL